MFSRVIKNSTNQRNVARHSSDGRYFNSNLLCRLRHITTSVGAKNQTSLQSDLSEKGCKSPPFSSLDLRMPSNFGSHQITRIDAYKTNSAISFQSRAFSSQQTPPWLNIGGQQKPGEALAQYSTDLTQMAADGKLDPVIGRHEEIRRTLQILARRTKNNPILIGEPGEYSSLNMIT